MDNIEKSAFHKGQYVAYACGYVWTVKRSNSSAGNWVARPSEKHGYPVQVQATYVYGHTLQKLSDKLKAFKFPA